MFSSYCAITRRRHYSINMNINFQLYYYFKFVFGSSKFQKVRKRRSVYIITSIFYFPINKVYQSTAIDYMPKSGTMLASMPWVMSTLGQVWAVRKNNKEQTCCYMGWVNGYYPFGHLCENCPFGHPM